MPRIYRSIYFWIGAIAIVLIALTVHNKNYGKVKKFEDIYYLYSDSKTISKGGNPYLRTLDGDMRNNNKYSTYFPMFFELGALTIKMGLKEYSDWLKFWQIIFLISVFAAGFMIFHIIHWSTQKWYLALFGTVFFIFNRMTINISVIEHIDILSIFFLLLSLSMLKSNFKWALIWFGVSLAIKQVAIFMVPLYFIWAWQQKPGLKNQLQTLLWGGLVPIVTALPFLIWNFKAFIYSVFFSATRYAASHMRIKSFDDLHGWVGLPAKIPMLIMMIAVFILAARKHLPPFASSFMIMTIFIGYNSVLMNQYLVWPVALLPLLFVEIKSINTHKSV